MASFFQKAGQPQVQTTTPTPGAGSQPLWQQLLQSALTGAKALGGDSGSLKNLMNPMQSVLGPFFDLLRKQAVRGANDTATAMGGGGSAFDTTRAAAMAGSELSGVDTLESQLTYQNATDALNRAMGLSEGVMGMGMGSQQQIPTEWSPLSTLAGLAMEPFGGGTGLFGLYHPPQAATGAKP